MLEKLELYTTISKNTKDLISILPQNSPFRRPLLFWFTKNLSSSTCLDFYGISQHTYNRLHEEEDVQVLQRKYAINVKRK